MPQSVRQYWTGIKGRAQLNFNWPAINEDSVVIVTASEYTPNPAAPKSAHRFVGSANLKIANVTPHGPPDDPNHGVTFVVVSDWPQPLDVVTDITVLDSAPVDIEAVEPPGQLDFDIPSITFGNGVPVGGNAHLTLWNNGNYVFSGHFHDSGATEYDMQLVIAVSDGTHAYTFEHQGHVSGTFESGSRDDDWTDTGTRPELVASWFNIAARNSWSWKADANSDLSNLVNAAVGALGTALGIIAIVAA